MPLDRDEREEKEEKEEKLPYYALAMSKVEVKEWCGRWKVRRQQVKAITHLRDMRGVGNGYRLILFGGWQANRELRGLVADWFIKQATTLHYPDSYQPLVDSKGRIVGWKPREERVE